MSHWLIHAPPYRPNSAGKRAMFRLCDRLRAIGEDAYVTERCRPVSWDCPVSTTVRASTIAVYAEHPGVNLLNARQCVRWLLNEPGWLGSVRVYPPWDVVVTWADEFTRGTAHEGAPVVRLGVMEPGLFYRPETPGTLRLGYVGKGPHGSPMDETGTGVGELARWAPVPEVDEWMTREWPTTRDDVACLLRRASDLFSYDDRTYLADEAAACGVRVWTPRDGAWSRHEAWAPVPWDDTTGAERLVQLCRERGW